MEELRENIARVQARLAAAARSAGRSPAEITLVAVSKTHPAATVQAAAALGLSDFGENRLEEALPKMAAAGGGLRWHMLGQIQSRKAAAAAAAGFALIHSVDSVKLAGRLDRAAQGAGRPQPVLLECNVSGEASKSGFAAQNPAAWDGLARILEPLAALPGIRVAGLMTVAPAGPEPAAARPVFARLRELRDYLQARLPGGWGQLSMGMTDDFEAAIAEGATLVRIGRAIFGARAG